MRRIIMALALCASLGSVAALQSSGTVNKAWAVGGYLYSANGGSAGGGLAISLGGVWHGAVYGAILGGPAGVAVGAGIGV